MAHYFDDIFHRHIGGAQTPRSPMMSPRLRRSSTSRSLAARSDFDINDLNGYADEADGKFPPRKGSIGEALYMSNGHGNYDSQNGNQNGYQRGHRHTTSYYDPRSSKERQESEAHLHAYITQQLEKVKMERGAEIGIGGGDELEAQPE